MVRITSSNVVLCPDCARCGGKTRLFGIEPHPTVDRTDLRTYVCARCDGVQTEVVPLPILTWVPAQ
jgi:hypothetical protein